MTNSSNSGENKDKKIDTSETKSIEIVPTLTKITDHQLVRVTNYYNWCKTIILYLCSIDKDDHITDNPPQDDLFKPWLRDDVRLSLQILFVYGKKNISRIYDVCKAFYRAEKHDKSITVYFMDFKKIYEELNKLMPFSANIKVQQQQREQMAVMSFLTGLPPEFESSKSQILTSSEEFSLTDVFSRILRTERSPTNVPSPSALVSTVQAQPQIVPSSPIVQSPGPHATQRTEYRHPRGENPNEIVVVCHYCHKPGHLKRDCRKLQYNNRRTSSAHVASRTDGSNQSVMISADEFVKFTLYQDSLKGSSTPTASIGNSGSYDEGNYCSLSVGSSVSIIREEVVSAV
ncbi:hypothetical protein LIER_07936 [Lithospermum erythrorhizon]|uniref:CCHC-type domain-containing protein n=1 Tax=Lithospermum erythrorhizon TaxID=34254 RepID=A0AAV3PB05_LITER